MTQSPSYKRYLASREWMLRKRPVYKRADDGRRCERCQGGAADDAVVVAAVHHRTYERVGREAPEDLLAVCAACHAFLGGFSDIDPIIEYLEGEIRQSSLPGIAEANGRLIALARAHPDWTLIEVYDADDAGVAA